MILGHGILKTWHLLISVGRRLLSQSREEGTGGEELGKIFKFLTCKVLRG